MAKLFTADDKCPSCGSALALSPQGEGIYCCSLSGERAEFCTRKPGR